MSKERILIADDEDRIRDLIKEYFIMEGYEIDEASDGSEALALAGQNSYAILILDVMMPRMDGWSVCREIRRSSRVPIVMLTARGEEYDKLFGFELGVDDYMVKPFSPKELLARVKAIIRRSMPETDGVAETGTFRLDGLEIEFESRNVYVDGEVKNLTPKEYELLQFFVRHPGKVFSREQLLDSVWGYEYAGEDRTVDTHVKLLREILGKYRPYIATVWGTGYKFETGGKKR